MTDKALIKARRSATTTLRLPVALMRDLGRRAREEGRSRNEVVRRAVEAYLTSLLKVAICMACNYSYAGTKLSSKCPVCGGGMTALGRRP